ncbi:MAG: hydrolase [Campylobacterales bacterium]|nr:hydrolase [Campylobacterales bacterium]
MNFTPPKLLSNRHIQTLYPALFSPNYTLNFEIEEFRLSDGDFVDCYWLNKDKSQNIVILFHGLGGSYQSNYIQYTMKALWDNGFSSVLMHFRGCSGRMNIHARAYHSGDTGDALEWIEEVRGRYPKAKIHLIGFSLGANMLLKLLGTHNPNITSAIAISPPLDLILSANKIGQGFSNIYQRKMVAALNQFLLRKYQTHNYEKLINLKAHEVKKIKTFWEFDERYTAPIHGFNSAHHYYSDSSALHYLGNIQTPTLLIMAQDDPVTHIDSAPKNISNNLQVECYAKGGHVGFIAGSLWRPEYWLQKRVLEYLNFYK